MIIVTDDDFVHKTATGVVLVDFYAEWCGPCRMQTPILEGLSKEMTGKVMFVKLDIDTSPKTTMSFGVTSIPTLIVLRDGKEVKRVVGLRDADTLRSILTAA